MSPIVLGCGCKVSGIGMVRLVNGPAMVGLHHCPLHGAADIMRNALITIAETVDFVATSRQLNKKLRSGLEAVSTMARAAAQKAGAP